MSETQKASSALATELHRLRTLLAAKERRIQKLEGALEAFLGIADDAKKASEESWGRARQMQEAATLARAGRQDEAIAIRDRIDRQPRVWDFSKTVERLADAAKKARKALSTPSTEEKTEGDL